MEELDINSSIPFNMCYQSCITTYSSSSILYQKITTTQYRFVVIDNLGCANVVPAWLYIKYFARRKTLRRWNRFGNKLWNNYDAILSLSNTIHVESERPGEGMCAIPACRPFSALGTEPVSEPDLIEIICSVNSLGSSCSTMFNR